MIAEEEAVIAEEEAAVPEEEAAVDLDGWSGGATKITTSTTADGTSYSSTTGGQNALEVSGGTSVLGDITVTKSGAESSESADFYGTNAAILVYNGAKLTIDGGTVTTNGSHANAIFAYGSGTVVTVNNVTVNTSQNNSGGVMVTGGGTITANNCTVTTQSASSAAIRSDRGGGTLIVNGGTYTSKGRGSPAIYSTAAITVNDAALISTSAEGVVIEGKNSISLNRVSLTDTNGSLNGQSTTYKNIFLYQSMSGDASVGTAQFSAADSRITTNKGDVIYVTNTTATVYLRGNTFVTNDSSGYFLRAKADSWGNTGSNGGKVTLTLDNQDAAGDIYIDSVSTLSMTLKNGSDYVGAINKANSAKSIALTLDAGSTLKLTSNSYVTSLNDADPSYGNIDFNGYTLYVNGTPIAGDGWVKNGGRWYYYKDRELVKGWLPLDSGTYYLDLSSGAMVTGWKQIDGAWYYFASSGAMKTGWLKSGGVWYYLDSDGKMLADTLRTIGGATYGFKSSGAMITGWKQIDGAWYYFASSGAMKTGWLKSGGVWYYLDSGGKMISNTLAVIGSASYGFKSSGAMATGWFRLDGEWYYFASSGAMQTQRWVKSSGRWYYLGGDGAMVKDCTISIRGTDYTFDAGGVWIG